MSITPTAAPITTYYQLNDDFTYQSTTLSDSKPHLAVITEPPVASDGHIQFWQTTLDPVLNPMFGNPGTGEWLVLKDNRKTELYKKTNGEKYELDKYYNGLGAIPEHLTDKSRPTDDHVWKNNDWWIDPATKAAADEAAIKVQVDAQIQAELARANTAIIPLQDAVELDMATEEESTLYSQWRTYRVLINRIATQTGYPLNFEWPSSPD